MRKCAFTLSGPDSPLQRFLGGDDAKIVSASLFRGLAREIRYRGGDSLDSPSPLNARPGLLEAAGWQANGMSCRVIWVCRHSP